MTLEELKTKCEEQGFQYAYGLFKSPVEPPHLIAIIQESNNFLADNHVFYKKNMIKLDYTYIDKDEDLQNLIEDTILRRYFVE